MEEKHPLHQTARSRHGFASAALSSTGAAAGPSAERRSPLDDAERRVVRQFVEALLFERIVQFRAEAMAELTMAEPTMAEPTTAEPTTELGPQSGETIYDQRFEFEVGERRYTCRGTLGAFERVRIRSGSICRRIDGSEYEVDVFEFVNALSLGKESSQRLREELAQTTSISRFNEKRSNRSLPDRRRLGFEELEGAIAEGHQYHPSFKSRTGFTLRDHEEYSGESGNTFQLHFLAVSRHEMKLALPTNEVDFWTAELGAEPYAVLLARLVHLGKNPREYALVPAHPFQLRALHKKGLQEAVQGGRVVPLGQAGDAYRGTQSLRTLTNSSHKTKANVKLPLDVFCTSCRRNFRKHFVCTAPALSTWLTSLVEGDSFLQKTGHLALLKEYAAILWDPGLVDNGAGAAEVALLDGTLGALFRQSVSARLAPGESAVPFTALALEEADGRPFVADWLAEYGIEAWVARLIEVTVIPIWHMLVHHGVAFEAHAQNLILVHQGGWPERIVLRDFHEDTEFVPEFLRARGGVPDFAAIDPYFATVPDDDGYRMGSVEDLRQLYMDTVYVFNLTEVSFLLHRHGILSEERFWRLVRRALDDYAAAQITEPARIARVNCDRPRIVVESLLKKTMERGKTLDFFEHEVRNTLGK